MFSEFHCARVPAAPDPGPEREAGGQRELPPGAALHHHHQVHGGDHLDWIKKTNIKELLTQCQFTISGDGRWRWRTQIF